VSDQDKLLVFGLVSGHETMSGGLGGFEQPVDVLNMFKFIQVVAIRTKDNNRRTMILTLRLLSGQDYS